MSDASQLVNGVADPLLRVVDESAEARVVRGVRAAEADRKRKLDKPLLGSVVKVALEPSPLGVARRHDPGAGGLQVLDARADLDFEPLVVEPELSGGDHVVDDASVVEQTGSVDQHRDGSPL